MGAALAALSGCMSLDPDYTRPSAPVPESYVAAPGAEPAGLSVSTAQAPPWRDYFTDPLLQRLIDTALANSRDIRIAAARVAEARAAWRCPPSAPMRQIEGSV